MARGRLSTFSVPGPDDETQPPAMPGETPADTNAFLPDRLSALDAAPSVPGPVGTPGPAPAAAQAPLPGEEGDLDLPDKPAALQGVYQGVSRFDPDHAAKVIGIARRIAEPEAFVDKNLPNVEKALSAPDGSFFKQLETQYPGTTKWLSDPKNMAVAQDDLYNAASHEHVIRQAKEAHGLIDSFLAGLEGSSGGLMARRKVPDIRLAQTPSLLDAFSGMAGQTAGDLPAMAAGGILGAPVGASVGAVAGSMVGGIPGIGVGATYGAGAGASAGAFALPAAIRNALMQKYAEGQITSYADVLKEAAKQGTVGAVAGAARMAAGPAGALAKAYLPESGIGGLLGRAVTSTAAAPIAELGAMTTAGAAVEGKAPSAADVAGNALLMGAMHGVHPLAEKSIDGLRSILVDRKTQVSADAYKAMGEVARASKLRARLPEAQNALVSDLAAGSSVENVYIPADRFQEYFQSQKLDPDQVAQELGAADSLKEARETGGPVRIKFADWVEKMTDQHFTALADDVKFDPDDFTPREAADKRAQVQAQVEELADQNKRTEAEAQAKAAESDRQARTARVAQAVTDQLKAAGYSAADAKANAALHRAFFTRLGGTLGVEPEELISRYPLTIEREGRPSAPGAPTGTEAETPGEGAPAAAPLERAPAERQFDPDVLRAVRDEIAAGEHIKGNLTRDQEGSITGRYGSHSTFPEYFKDKGYSKKGALSAIDKYLAGGKLTPNQEAMLRDLHNDSGYAKEPVGERVAAEPFLQAMRAGETDVDRTNLKKASVNWVAPEQHEPARGSDLTQAKHSPGIFQNADTGELIRVNADTRRKAINFARDVVSKKESPTKARLHMAALQHMGELAKEAILVSESHDTKDRPGRWQYFFAPLRMEGKDFLAKLEVSQGKDGAALHNYVLIDPRGSAKQPEGLIAGSSYATTNPRGVTPIDDFTRLVKSARESYEHFQPGGEGPRGMIRIGGEGSERSFSIDLLKNADKSTFLHETGHYFLEVLGDVASKDNAPQAIKDDYQSLLKWFGVDSRDQIGVEHHEQFARGFEKYLAEGKAPSAELRRPFDRFRKWLTSIYRDLRYLKVDLTPEVRGVMDRMLASRESIEMAQRAIGAEPREIPGLTPEMGDKIRDLEAQARGIAESQLIKEQMPELRAERKAFLKSERERMTNDAEAQVKAQPLYAAIDALHEESGKRDSVQRAERYLTATDRGGQGEAAFDVQAELRGFPSGEELARQILQADRSNDFRNRVSGLVESGMQKHADLMDTAALHDEALKAIHNEKMTELLALERQALQDLVEKKATSGEVSRRRRIEARIEAQTARDEATRILQGKPVKEATNARIYVTAERNAAVKAAQAIARGDYEKAQDLKRQQMLNHALAREAMNNEETARKAQAFLNTYAHRGTEMKDMPYGFVRQIDALLRDRGMTFDRSEAQDTLREIAKKMAAEGEEPSDIANRTGMVEGGPQGWRPEELPDLLARVNENYYSVTLPDSVMKAGARDAASLTMSELTELKDGVAVLADVGKKFERFLGDFKTADIKEAAAALRKSVAENYGTPYAKDLLPGSQHETKLAETLSLVTRIPGALARQLDTMLTTVHKLDGLKEGPAKDNLYRPFEEAESRKLARTKQSMEDLDKIFAKHYAPDEFAGYKDKRITVDGRTFTKEEILSMALNWGNEGNRDRLMRGFSMSQGEFERLFDSSLGKKDWDFAQDVWRDLQKYWPDISRLEMDVNGVMPLSVEPTPFENIHGSYEGGYYPIVYDFEKSADAFRNAEAKDALYKKFSSAKAHTEQGHTESRVARVTRPLKLSLDVLRNHHEDVIHDLEFRKPVIDASRFLNQRDVKSGLTEALGVRGYAAINDWVKAVAGGSSEPLNAWSQAWRWFRFRTTFFNLAYRLTSAPKIAIENMVNVSSELGVSGAARSIKDYYLGESGMHDLVISKSEFMKQRANHLDRDMADINKKWQGTQESSFRRYAFAIHAQLDQGVSFPLWADVYKRAMADHGEERLAVNQADEAVKRTFMSGGGIDQAQIMRGGEMQKGLTTAYGYQSMMWNRFSLSAFAARQAWLKGDPMAAAMIAGRASIYQFVLPGLVAALTREFLRNNQGGSKQDQEKRVTATLLEEGNPLKFIPILRDVSPYVIHKVLGERTGDLHFTPLEQAAQTVLEPAIGMYHSFAGHAPDPKAGEHAANAVSLMTGIPKQFNDVAFNFIDWSRDHGEATWRDFISRRTKK